MRSGFAATGWLLFGICKKKAQVGDAIIDNFKVVGEVTPGPFAAILVLLRAPCDPRNRHHILRTIGNGALKS